jgi:hypothetical protein
VHSLELAGGLNRFREPNYRAIWGWNRLAWIGGKFEERDSATGSLLREVVELRQEPNYPAVNRWHIEKWLPSETYGSPRAWWAQTAEIEGGRSVPALGPYPARRIRTLLHAGRAARSIRAAHANSGRAHRARHRVVAPPPAFSREARPLRSRAAPRKHLRRVCLRHPRRHRPGIPSPAVCGNSVETKKGGPKAAQISASFCGIRATVAQFARELRIWRVSCFDFRVSAGLPPPG